MAKKKYRNDYDPMSVIRKKIPPHGFDFKDKSKYDRKKKHKDSGDSLQET